MLSFIIDTASPVSIVERESFKALFKGTGLKIMSRKVTMAKLDSKYNEMMLKVKNKMAKMKNFCTTADIWSTNHRSFWGILVTGWTIISKESQWLWRAEGLVVYTLQIG